MRKVLPSRGTQHFQLVTKTKAILIKHHINHKLSMSYKNLQKHMKGKVRSKWSMPMPLFCYLCMLPGLLLVWSATCLICYFSVQLQIHIFVAYWYYSGMTNLHVYHCIFGTGNFPNNYPNSLEIWYWFHLMDSLFRGVGTDITLQTLGERFTGHVRDYLLGNVTLWHHLLHSNLSYHVMWWLYHMVISAVMCMTVETNICKIFWF